MTRVTALEIDERLARSLGARLRDSNVTVVQGDATAMPFRLLHVLDTMVPVDPAALPDRLRRAGFVDVAVEHDPAAALPRPSPLLVRRSVSARAPRCGQGRQRARPPG